MAHRYFTKDIGDGAARLAGPDAAHLARVLRAQPGQRVCLCNGAGTDYEAEIVSATPDEVLLRVLSQAPTAAEPSLRAEVYPGMAKGDRMDWAIQKSVELGAAAFFPFYGENSVVKPKNEEDKARRWARIAAEAAKQAGRGILPPVAAPVPFAAALGRAAACDAAFLFHEKATRSLPGALAGFAGGSVALLTGPEGGFSPAEAEAAERAGCRIVGLGPRILRCETAPLAALAAVMALTGNLEAAGT